MRGRRGFTIDKVVADKGVSGVSIRHHGDHGRVTHTDLGLVIGRAKMNVFVVRAAELIEDRPELAAAVEPLLKAREAVEGRPVELVANG
jgi:hypothetical protein